MVRQLARLCFEATFGAIYTNVLIYSPHILSGVNVKMITGDHLLIAKQTAKALAMGDKIFDSENLPMLDPETKLKPAGLGKTYGNLCLAADGFAQVFPEHKVRFHYCTETYARKENRYQNISLHIICST